MGTEISRQILKKTFIIFACFLFTKVNANSQACFSTYNAVPKYGPDTKHFDYVNPNAPKGGALKMPAFGTFDGLNPLAIFGINPVHIRIFCFAKLLGESPEEVGVSYPYLAKKLQVSEDKRTITFFLDDSATFSDGTPITADDVVWSFNFAIKINPMMKQYYKDVEKAEAVDAHTVIFYSKNPKNKELPGILGQIEIFPSKFFKVNMTENGCITKPFPVSGPYKISEVDFGRTITFERVKNWWGEKLSLNAGLYNFDQISLRFYRDRVSAFQAFLAGDLNLWIESSAKQWHTAYDVPPVKDGKIIKKTIPDGVHLATRGFVFNLRKDKFKDIRVRKAISNLFNFESLNRSTFYKHYYRLNSYYGAELAHSGAPKAEELILLEKYKDQLPDEVFGNSFKNNSYEADIVPRDILQQSLDLLKEAGWELKDQKLVNEAGEEFQITIPYADTTTEPIILHMQRNFQAAGIKVSTRHVDASTFNEMVEQFDYDMVFMIVPQSHSLGNEQREFFGSKSANIKGSKNLAGIENKVIDELIERLIVAKDYQDMLDCSHAIDRVLSWNYYMIMGWSYDGLTVAYWNTFGFPKLSDNILLKHVPFPMLYWWNDPSKLVKNQTEESGLFDRFKTIIKSWF